MLKTQPETLSQCLEEMKQIFSEHHLILCTYPQKMPLDPRYDEYFAAERVGRLQVITVRDGDELVGYYIGFVGGSLHYQSTPSNVNDIFYIKPDHRFKGAGTLLFRAVQADNKLRGIKYWRVETKKFSPVTEFMKELGFEVTAETHTMWLGD